ncbi:hypothetical protein BDAP_002232 [Binucleata daphniae]
MITVLPTDIFYLKNIVSHLHTYKNDYSIHLQVWFFVLLQNPFDIKKILTKNETNNILQFLAENINKRSDLIKYNVRTIAMCYKSSIDCEYKDVQKTKHQNNENKCNMKDNRYVATQTHKAYTSIKTVNDTNLNISDDYVIAKQVNTSINTANDTILAVFDKYGFTETIKYRIIYEMVKISKHTRNMQFDIKFDKNDNIAITRYKIKIISHQDFSQNNLNNILQFIDTENTKLGWTLSKSVVMMLKNKDYKAFMMQLQKMMFDSKKNKAKNMMADHALPNNDDKTTTNNTDESKNINMCNDTSLVNDYKEIYNENLWINATTILAMLTLNKTSNSNIFDRSTINFYQQTVCSMIFYTNKTNNKSEYVRQTGLFLFWVCIRSNMEIFRNKTAILYLVLVSLTDNSLTCRRAASTVLFEFFGRYEIKNSNAITNLINFHSVKRMENNVKTIRNVMNIYPHLKQPVIYELYKKNEYTLRFFKW